MSLVSTRSNSDADQMSVDVIDQRPPPTTVAALIAAKEEAAKAVQSEKESAPPVHHSFVKSSAALFSPNRITSKFQQPRPQEITLPAKSSTALSPFASIKKSLVRTASTFLSAHKSDAVALFSSATKKGPKIEPDVPIVDADSAAMVTEVTSVPALPVAASLDYSESVKDFDVSSVNSSTSVKIPSDGTKDASLKAPFSSSIVKDKQKMLADARKQRLAELRGKSKPITAVVAASTTSHVLKPSNSKQNEPLKPVALSTISQTTTPIASSVPGKSAVALNEVPIKTTVASVWPPPPPEKPQLPENPLLPPANELNIRSPLDTYQISDRDESDSDESDDSGSGPKKKIPDWAQKENLITALKQQYDENGNRLDPDALFPEVETCDLEAIFDKKRNRFKKRTSSGNWTKDRVTAAEKLVYKRTMGFDSTS
ncbi:inner centromere protein [Fragilaria crotonensis]|nr:inner centromere protein [Fragilaria crotonensis]